MRVHMTELKFFRLTCVLLAALVLSAGSGWAYCTHKQRLAEAAVDASFGEYNRYIQACGDDTDGAWDLAERAHDSLHRASAQRDAYEERADALMWFAVIACPCVVAAFYALRWAMKGRVRPLWPPTGYSMPTQRRGSISAKGRAGD